MTIWILIFCVLLWLIVHPKAAIWAFVVLEAVAFVYDGWWERFVAMLFVGHYAATTLFEYKQKIARVMLDEGDHADFRLPWLAKDGEHIYRVEQKVGR